MADERPKAPAVGGGTGYVDGTGFRAEETQTEAMKEFERQEAEKREQERLAAEEALKAREQAVFEATKQSVAAFKAAAKQKELEEQRKKEEAHQNLVASAFAKHHNLRKSLREKEEKKEAEERRKKEEFEAKRKKKLEAQANKMKRFEEETRWKKLPKWQKEREEEYLEMVKKLQSLDPSRDKYEFFDVHEQEAWNAPKLTQALEDAESKVGVERFAELLRMDPQADKATVQSDGKWDFDALDELIKKTKAEIEEENRQGEALFNELLQYSPQASNDEFYQTASRPNWDSGALGMALTAAKHQLEQDEKQGEELFATLLKYQPSWEKSEYLTDGPNGSKRWDVKMLESAVLEAKKSWADLNASGEKLFGELCELVPESKREDYYLGEEVPAPWDLDKMKFARGDRLLVTVQYDSDAGPQSIKMVGSGAGTVGDFRQQVADKISFALKAVTLVFNGTQYNDKSGENFLNYTLEQIGVNEAANVVIAVVSTKSAAKKAKQTKKPAQAQASQGAQMSAGGDDETPDKVPAPSGCCVVQ